MPLLDDVPVYSERQKRRFVLDALLAGAALGSALTFVLLILLDWLAH